MGSERVEYGLWFGRGRVVDDIDSERQAREFGEQILAVDATVSSFVVVSRIVTVTPWTEVQPCG